MMFWRRKRKHQMMTSNSTCCISRYNIYCNSESFQQNKHLMKPSSIDRYSFTKFRLNEHQAVGGKFNMEYYVDVSKKNDNMIKLYKFAQLEEGWDGYDAPNFPLELITKCMDVISNIEKQPDIYPTGRNSIQFEYELANGKYLEFELFDDKIGVYFIKDNGSEELFDINYDIDLINQYVKRFYEQ